jgi:hypothetical protein
MITMEQFQQLAPGEIFETGVSEIEHPWYRQAPNIPEKVMIKWVAVRGDIPDWAVYYTFDGDERNLGTTASLRAIAGRGFKIHDEKLIQKLVDPDAELLRAYRH